MASTPPDAQLKDTQIVVIDKEFIAPASKGVAVMERTPAAGDPDHPPLISHYDGP
jgi:hypothetical protein